MRRGTVVSTALAAIVLLLLAGCGNQPSTNKSESRHGDDGLNEPQAERSAGLPSGVVTATLNYPAGTTLAVYDISSGRLLEHATLPPGAISPEQEQFDPTMRHYAYVSDCALTVASLTDGTYVNTAQWEAPQAYGQGRQCFDRPKFTQDGRVRARVSANHEDGRLVSVDPKKPGSSPRDEGSDSERDEQRFEIANTKGSDVRVWASGTDIDSVMVTGSIPSSDVIPRSFSYQCDWPIDEVTYVCASDNGKSEQRYGSVAIVKVERASKTVTMKQVAPAGETTNATAIPSPDGKHVAINDTTGWYLAVADGASAPIRQPLSDTPDIGDVLFWH